MLPYIYTYIDMTHTYSNIHLSESTAAPTPLQQSDRRHSLETPRLPRTLAPGDCPGRSGALHLQLAASSSPLRESLPRDPLHTYMHTYIQIMLSKKNA